MKKSKINQRLKNASAIALLVIICACGQSKDTTKAVAAKIDPIQATCVADVAKRQKVKADEFLALRMEAMSAQRSSIDITLAQRRANEQACLDYAQCFTMRDSNLNSIVISTMFDSCLSEVNR